MIPMLKPSILPITCGARACGGNDSSAENVPIGRDTAEINIWRLQSLFNNFRRILFLNNAILEDMAQMEQALGGEYIFDRAFLETSVRTLSSRVHHVTYNLNALTGNAYIPLYDRYQDIRTILDDILSGNVRALAGTPVLPLQAVGWELEPLVGIDLVCLAELRHHPGSLVAAGFIITAEGTRALIGSATPAIDAEPADISATEVRAGIDEQLKVLLGNRKDRRFSVVAIRLEGKEESVRELGRFALVPDANGARVETVVEASFLGQSAALAGVASQGDTAVMPSPGDCFAGLYVLCLEQIVRTVFSWLKNDGTEPAGHFAVFVRDSPPADICGTVRTRTISSGSSEVLAISASLPDSRDGGDTFLLRRTYPFDLVQSTITPRPVGYHFPDGRLATGEAAAVGGLGRGSALVQSKTLKNLAETAMTLERMMGTPVAVQWECRNDGNCCITGLSPMPVIVEEISGR